MPICISLIQIFRKAAMASTVREYLCGLLNPSPIVLHRWPYRQCTLIGYQSNTRKELTLVNATNITASVFINDDESGLHYDYEVWLERLAPHAPLDQCRPRGRAGPQGRLHNRTGEDACPSRTGPPTRT
jgi:hypothetical protein